MNQSSFIAAFLLAGFVLYLAAKNRLSAYTAVLWGSTAAPLPSVGSSGYGPNNQSFSGAISQGLQIAGAVGGLGG